MAPPKFMGLTGRPLSLMVSTVATTGFVLFGYDQGVMSGIITAPAFNDLFTATNGNSTMQGFVTAIYEIGCLFGAIFILAFGDFLGRRKAMMMGGSIMIVGVIIQVTSERNSTPLAQFIIGRTITGVGNGLLICIEGGVIAFGTLVAYWIDYGASYGSADLSWRFPIAFQIVFALVVALGPIWLPESPRWLLTRERYEEGETVIAALRGLEREDKETQLQKQIIMDSIRASGYAGRKGTPLKAVFSGGKTQHFRRMMLGVSSQFMQQVGGCNAVIYYFPILFENSIGQSHNISLLLGGVNMIVYAIFATVSWFIIERVGRRKLFLWGTVGQCLSMVLVFSCLIPGTPAAAKGAAVGLFTYIASFGASWLPLPWLYPAEINPIKTRQKANALSTCSNWLFNFLIVMITPIMISHIHWGTYLFFAIVNACFLPLIYFTYPETARRSLEEIDIIFAKGYVEGKGYVRAARELEFLGDEGVDRMARVYGLVEGEGDGREVQGEKAGNGVWEKGW
ncbi:putative hexose carrier protein [Usnea florida]